MYLVRFFLRSFCSLAACCFAIFTLSCAQPRTLRRQQKRSSSDAFMMVQIQYHAVLSSNCTQSLEAHPTYGSKSGGATKIQTGGVVDSTIYLYAALHDGMLDCTDHLIHVISCASNRALRTCVLHASHGFPSSSPSTVVGGNQHRALKSCSLMETCMAFTNRLAQLYEL